MVSILLQAEEGPVPWVNLAVIVLIVIFLTVPFVFLLAEYARNRGPSHVGKHGTPSNVGVQSKVPGSLGLAARQRRPLPADRAIHIVLSSDISHSFARERVPKDMGYVPSDHTVQGPIEFRGYLEIGARSVINGPVKVYGSLALDNGAEISGDVETTGNVYVGVGSVINGTVRAGNKAFLARWSRILQVEAKAGVEFEEGSEVTNSLSAPHIEQVESILEKPAV